LALPVPVNQRRAPGGWFGARSYAPLLAAMLASVRTLSADGDAIQDGGPASLPLLRFLGPSGHTIEPIHGDVLGVSRHMTDDASGPSSHAESGLVAADREAFRLELRWLAAPSHPAYVTLESVTPANEIRATLRYVPLLPTPSRGTFETPLLTLVADRVDTSAPGSESRTLLVALGDSVRAAVHHEGVDARAEIRVGGGHDALADRVVLRSQLRVIVLRVRANGPPSIGEDEAGAIALARRQVEIANEIWAQCFIYFGVPQATPVQIADPPPPALLAIADHDGLPARGGGKIRFVANRVVIGPLQTRPGESPRETARRIAHALVRKGFNAEVSINPRAELGAGESADLVVRTRSGSLATLGPVPGAPLSTDAQQSISIGSVRLEDGLEQFDNMSAASGTLEERTLVKTLADRTPSTIELFIVNHFSAAERQGEAFIEADGSAIANAIILDRSAVRFERQAWVQAHELGHVLMNEPFHPDNFGQDRPSLLMDSDARAGRVSGPKRLRDADCDRARRRTSSRNGSPIVLRDY